MKNAAGLIIAMLVWISSAAADVVTIPGSVNYTSCIHYSGDDGRCYSGINLDFRVDQEGGVTYLSSSTLMLAGTWDLTSDFLPFTLPSGATINSESITFGNVQTDESGLLPAIASATLNSVIISQGCCGASSEFSGAFTGTNTLSLPIYSGPDLGFQAEFGGQASLDVVFTNPPSTPGYYSSSASLVEVVDFSYAVDYSVPSALPEPGEAGPIALIAAVMALRWKWRSRRPIGVIHSPGARLIPPFSFCIRARSRIELYT